MNINIIKLTDDSLMRTACEFTMHKKNSNMTLDKIYKCQHSPIRTQIFCIKLIDVPTFVSVHFVRHNIGVTHFVMSNRDDRGGDGDNNVNRLTPVNHMMIINAEAIINLSRKRLCYQAHEETRKWMEGIKQHMIYVDQTLAKYMVPECIYRGGKCHELRSCGHLKELIDQYECKND